MTENILEIVDSSFKSQVLTAGKPAMVDFWAPWCGPCKAITPLIEELAAAYGAQMIFGKCNVDENPVTPSKYGIRAIPTLIFFKDGQVLEQITGMVAKAKLEGTIKNVISGVS